MLEPVARRMEVTKLKLGEGERNQDVPDYLEEIGCKLLDRFRKWYSFPKPKVFE